MATAFCPGHITCFFRPAGNPGEDVLSRGSVGAGIRTSLGATVEVSERPDRRLVITMDGAATDALVTQSVFRQLAPGSGFDVTIENELPCGEGFGMSAAGAIAAAMALSEIVGGSVERCFEVAHIAEIEGGGGLGDVSAIKCLVHQPVRVRQGLPPHGEVIGTPVSFEKLSLAVLGPKMNTGGVLRDPVKHAAIVAAGDTAVKRYLSDPNERRLYELSNRFSCDAGVECPAVSDAIKRLNDRGYQAAMCMLGNSVFSDAPIDEMQDILGDSVQVYTCSSTDSAPRIIRRA